MADLAIYDFDWIRGTTSPLIASFKINGTPIPVEDIRLSVFNSKTLAFRLTLADNAGTGPGTVSADAGTYTFTPTAEQTRLLKQGKQGQPGKSSYEIEIRNGTSEIVYMMGTINGIGGINDDEEVAS
jgi:hypothetical protein